MRLASLLLFVFTVTNTLRADDLDVLVSPDITPAERGQAYERLTKASFPVIAKPLLAAMGQYPAMFNPLVVAGKPWEDARMKEPQRIAATLQKLWHAQIESAQTPGQNMEILLDLLDDTSLGPVRRYAAEEVYACLDKAVNQPDPALPGPDMIARRLDHLAADAQQPAPLRASLFQILYTFGDPNAYLDRALAFCEAQKSRMDQEQFTEEIFYTDRSARLTEASRRKLVQHYVVVLLRSQVAKSGSAYPIAIQLGQFVGIRPQDPDAKPFAADLHLAKYSDHNQLWQIDTIKNALRWWDEHKAEYQEPAPK